MTALRFILILLFAPACAFGADGQAMTYGEEMSSSGSSSDDGADHPGFTPSPDAGINTDTGTLGVSNGNGSSDDDGSADSDTSGDDPSDGSNETDTSESGSDSSSSGDTPYNGPYGDCYDGPILPRNKLCDQSCVTSDIGDFSACAPDCADDPCESPGVCFTEIFPEGAAPVCVIDCSSDPCPGGMECKVMTYGPQQWDFCMWE